MSQKEIDPLSFLLFMPFYIIGFLVSTLPPLPQLPTVATATPQSRGSYSTMENLETWEIYEDTSGKVTMKIHRNVKKQ